MCFEAFFESEGREGAGFLGKVGQVRTKIISGRIYRGISEYRFLNGLGTPYCRSVATTDILSVWIV